MGDREKVIKGLESLRDICNAKSDMAIGEGRTAWAGYASVVHLAIALLREQKKACWISVKDRQPKEGQVCFVWGPTMTRPAFEAWNPRRGIPSVYPIVSPENETEFHQRYDWRWQFALYENGAITHWMPVKLPEPPEEA